MTTQGVNKFARNLQLLEKICSKYKDDNDYVYKLACDISSKKDKSRKWLVIMKKTQYTRTNEKRKGVFDYNHAKFRADKLMVIKIINTRNPKLTKKRVKNMYGGAKIIYEVNKITRPDRYDDDISNVCSGGVHYFKTIIAAYYYELPCKYSGHWIEWHNNGRKESEGECLEGKKMGYWIYWDCSGNKFSKGEFLNGKRNGNWIYWYRNGEKESEGSYENGVENGHWTYWNYKGEKTSDGSYLNGFKTGKWNH